MNYLKPFRHKTCPTPRAPDPWASAGALAPGWAMVAADCSLAQSPRFQAVSVAQSWFRQSGVTSSRPPAGTLRECLIIHHKGHEGTQSLEKIRRNLCESAQSVAESCPSEQINEVSTEFQNTL